MSHFSRIKTTIKNLNILQITLSNLGLDYQCGKYTIQDYNGNKQIVDVIIESHDHHSYGFSWNGKEYLFIADVQFWDQSCSIEKFIETISQKYAYNAIIEASKSEGFNCVNDIIMKDGTIKLVVQRWNY